jgi:hypothetical protein
MANLTIPFLNGKTESIDEMDIINCLSKAYCKWLAYRNGHMPIEFLEQNLTELVERNYKWCTALKVMMDSAFKYMIETKRDIAKYVPQNPINSSILEEIFSQWNNKELENAGSHQ